MKLSPAQHNAIRWYSLPAPQRRYVWPAQKDAPSPPKGSTIDALIRRGLLARVPHPEARNYTMVVITDDGRAAL